MSFQLTNLVFTDLDGTLLDHETYDWKAAKPSLTLLDSKKVPLIFATSKTAAELRVLCKEIGNDAPYIVENGAAVIIPAYWSQAGKENRLIFGVQRTEILSFLEAMRHMGHKFQSFFDMGIEGIMKATGLDQQAARRANERDHSEPLLFHGSDTARMAFLDEAHKAGLEGQHGGRFLTLGGKTDKGRAAKALIDYFQQQGHLLSRIVALGDSHNDIELLKSATHAVWVRKNSPSPNIPVQNNIRSTIKTGPEGWNDAILEIFNE